MYRARGEERYAACRICVGGTTTVLLVMAAVMSSIAVMGHWCPRITTDRWVGLCLVSSMRHGDFGMVM